MRHNSGFEPEPPPSHSLEAELNSNSDTIQDFADRMSYEQVIDVLIIIEIIRFLHKSIRLSCIIGIQLLI